MGQPAKHTAKTKKLYLKGEWLDKRKSPWNKVFSSLRKKLGSFWSPSLTSTDEIMETVSDHIPHVCSLNPPQSFSTQLPKTPFKNHRQDQCQISESIWLDVYIQCKIRVQFQLTACGYPISQIPFVARTFHMV